MEIKDFEKSDWTNIWAGSWSFLSCSHFSDQYTKEIIFGGKPFKSQSIIFIKKGKSAGWMRQSDRDRLGEFLAKEAKENNKKVSDVCATLKARGDELLSFITAHTGKDVDGKMYREFWERLLAYYILHIHVKYIVDYLEPSLLEKFLPTLQEARLHVEPVLNKTEDFMVAMAEKIAGTIHLPKELVLCFTKEEMYAYFTRKIVPSKKVLEERDKVAVIVADKDSSVALWGSEVGTVEKIVYAGKEDGVIKGSVAYKGKARGRVRVIHDPAGAKFEEGEILVASSTRPDYLPIMHKAVAFVTDAGGILSHAAIVARELKKPCVIGTQVATKVLKDGDLVEVDADKGTVKILKSGDLVEEE